MSLSLVINFLLETNLCIVNGRIKSINDNYTSVSSKGKAVVDYVIVLIQNINCDYLLKVHFVTELVSNLDLESDNIPDHSLLEFQFRFIVKSNYIEEYSPGDNLSMGNCWNSYNIRSDNVDRRMFMSQNSYQFMRENLNAMK